MINQSPNARRVLLVDPDEAFGNVLDEILGSEGYIIRQVLTPQAALPEIDNGQSDIILLNVDRWIEGAAGNSEFLRATAELTISLPIISFGWEKRSKAAIDVFRNGGVDFLEQPIDVQELRFAINRACRRSEMAHELAAAQRLLTGARVEGLLGNSKPMGRVHDVIHKVADVFTTVLITGESGTGKEVVANAVHRMSTRSNKPFVAFSVCSFPDSLIDDELFGHERGAFTGANQSRRGRFEEAHGGTIFIDEIGDLALPLQAKLLRVLQERTVDRLGSNASRQVDVRVICATNRNLEQMVREGTFREDLYFRISVVKIPLPPLRERSEDIPLLAEYFLRMFGKAHKKQHRNMTPGFLSALSRYGWPGNVRELQNVIERSVVLANGHDRLGVDDLPPELHGLSISDDLPRGTFHEAVKGFKRELVRSALAMHSGNRLKAAKELGISRCYLHRLLNQLNVVLSGEEEPELQDQDAEDLGRDREEDIPAQPIDPRVMRAARIA